MKRDKQIFVLIIFIIISILILVLFLILNNIQIFSGNTITNGGISLFIEAPINITIYSPENKTYEYNLSDGVFNPTDNKYYFLINLDVSSSIDVSDWHYSLYSGGILQDSYIDFIPNQTILARVGQNTLVIYAKSFLGRVYNKSVSFVIKTEMSSPIIDISKELIACEGEKLLVEYNITDYDSDLDGVDILPRDFFFTRIKSSLNAPYYIGEVYSGSILRQHNVGIYNKTLYAMDSKLLVDEKNTTIHVLDVNSVPEVESLGVYKIWTKGLSTIFDKSWQVIDSEDGSSIDGLMSFELTFADNTTFSLFEINKYGQMYYEAIGDDSIIGSFILKACVTDNPLILDGELENYTKEHCGEYSLDSNTVCEEFGFTVSDENRIPYILSIYPTDNNIVMNGTVEYYFNVFFGDLDNDVLLLSWYVDGIEKQSTLYYEEDIYEYSGFFNFSFECGVSGKHNISAVIYDGINSISKTWDIDVVLKECPKKDIISGGSKLKDCYELWTCYDWSSCQSIEESYKLNLISTDDYYSYTDISEQLGLIPPGYHIRECFDANNCSNLKYKVNPPELFEFCLYVINPSCFDGVRNCHSGGCEIGIDCGGPCLPCPTCSDGIKNQGEEGIDCGGPCPNRCKMEYPHISSWLLMIFILVLLILIIFIMRMILVIIKRLKKDKEEDRKERLMRAMGK